MANIAVITGASSGLGVKFLEAVVNRYSQMVLTMTLEEQEAHLSQFVPED